MGNSVSSRRKRAKTRSARKRPQADDELSGHKRKEVRASTRDRRLRRSSVVRANGRQNKTWARGNLGTAELENKKEVRMRTNNENANSEFQAMITKFREGIGFRPMRGFESVKKDRITVCIRKRPLNEAEVARKEVDVISVPGKDEIIVHKRLTKFDLSFSLKNQCFKFDYVFDETSSNKLVYKYTAKPLVKNVLEGGMSTCFAYGQTGSGKTHTMNGGKTEDIMEAIYAMTAEDVFKTFKSLKNIFSHLAISASFFEIYNGIVFDLLANRAKLSIREDRNRQVHVVGLTETAVDSVGELLELIEQGSTARTSGKTQANYNSSRSHAVFQIIVRKHGIEGVHGKFSMIDLAGNERRADMLGSNPQRRIEGAEINKSLLALRECIRALGTNGAHIPFRDSKLTHILRDSFIGNNSKTCIIATINPGMSSCECSLDTLRFVDRIKQQKSKIEEQLEKQRKEMNQMHQQQIEQQNKENYMREKQIRERQEMGKRLQERSRRRLQQQKSAIASARDRRQKGKEELKKRKEVRMRTDTESINSDFQSMITKYREGSVFRPMRGFEFVKKHRITVCIRKRPLNETEVARKEVDVISVPGKDKIVVHERRAKFDLSKYLENHEFRFDYVFDETSSNSLVYKYAAKPLLQNIFVGGMATCFAYGQTGSGKTHTMIGSDTEANGVGIYAMSAEDVFKLLHSLKYKFSDLELSASFFEIYNGIVFDLLANRAKLSIREDRNRQVHVVGLTETAVDSVGELLELIEQGSTARTSGKTRANYNSSRSHAVFQIIVRKHGIEGVHGKFSMIDLAGNERRADMLGSNPQRRIEGAEINKSLLALRECIRALGTKGARIPFRGSKLTHILRDSFIGKNSKTCIIATISPGMSSCECSLDTLRFVDRIRKHKEEIEEQFENQRLLLEPLPQEPQKQYRPARRRRPFRWLVDKFKFGHRNQRHRR